MRKLTCYELKIQVKKGMLLISNTSEFDLTRGRIYVATKNQGEDTFGDCFHIVNDKGEEAGYSGEYFQPYEGETVDS